MDTSAVFAALLSPTGGSRLLLKLGEAAVIDVVVGPRVLAEADAVVLRKAPDQRHQLALLLDRARVVVGPPPSDADLATTRRVVGYEPDAHVLAEAVAACADRFVTWDRQHFLEHVDGRVLPLVAETPGECLSWLRNRLAGRDADG